MTPRHNFQKPKLLMNFNFEKSESREYDDQALEGNLGRREDEVSQVNSKDQGTIFSGKSQNNDNIFNKSQRSNNRGVLYKGKMNSHMGKMNVLSKHNIAQKFSQGGQESNIAQEINNFETEITSKDAGALTPKRRMSSMSPLLKQDSSISAKQSNNTHNR